MELPTGMVQLPGYKEKGNIDTPMKPAIDNDTYRRTGACAIPRITGEWRLPQ